VVSGRNGNGNRFFNMGMGWNGYGFMGMGTEIVLPAHL